MTARRRGAILGFGRVAEKGHAPGWSSSPRFEIVAVADPSPQRRAEAERMLPGVRTYAEHDALLREETLDFVDVASPPAFHAGAIVAAAEAGLHVLCEKPVTTTREQYLPVRRAVAAAGVVLYPVHNWRYSSAFRSADENVRRGVCGTLQRIRFQTLRRGWAASDDDWRANAAIAGGGILVDHGWHTFYLLLGLAGASPLSLRARTETRLSPGRGVEDTAWCEVRFPDLTAEVELTWAADERRTRWEITGDRCTLVLEDDRMIVSVGGDDLSSPMPDSLSHGSHHPEWFPDVLDGFAAEIQVREYRGAGRREAEWCLTLLEHAYRSAAEGGREIALPDPDDWLTEGTL